MSIRRVTKVPNLVPVKHAFISVTDKTNLDVLASGLVENYPSVRIFSTGGTYDRLAEVFGGDAPKYLTSVSAYTGMPETEGGLVKSLHHRLFLGYLTEHGNESHNIDLVREGAVPIDLVVVNLYPFSEVARRSGSDIEDARGNIDVGGPSALRAAAKNWHRVATIVRPGDYGWFVNELKRNNGATELRTRFNLHKVTFAELAAYDSEISRRLNEIQFEEAVKAYEIK